MSTLTVKSIEKMQPARARREIADGLVSGLYLVVQPSGAKSWALRYRFQGQTRKLTLGPLLMDRRKSPMAIPAIGQPMMLAEARKAARIALQDVAEGHDPGTSRKADRAADLSGEDRVDTRSRQFIERYCKPRNRSWAEVERQFRVEIVPKWGSRRVREIHRRDVIEMIEGIVARGAPVQANRVLATLSRFFGWLAERDVVTVSPVEGIRKPAPEVSRDRILSDAEIVAFWNATEPLGYPFGTISRILLLTGQRRTEVSGTRWSDLDMDRREWLIPAERAKNGIPHTVPLADAVLATLATVPRVAGQDLLFSTTGDTPVSGWSKAKARLDALMEAELSDVVRPWALHDLRRTAASGMARLGVNVPVIEKVLNHVSGSFRGVAGVYNRHDFAGEKRAALDAWARCVIDLVERQPDNVVPLRG